ncbi:hypothetical protein T492DRAFT_1142593 [Pavlovales sp. CCMP2436]|nr:hypothetical protein T492DRAFT_1142593 [Pavlovales sp. CCMP2436]
MSTSQIERVRTLHEDIELLEKAAADELVARAAMKHRPEQIMSDHTTHALRDHILDRNAQLQALYADEDGLLRSEIDDITGDGAIEAFYGRFRRIRASHVGNELVNTLDADEEMVSAVLEGEPQIIFSGEEAEGKFLDLHASYAAFVNLRGIKPKAPDKKGAKAASAVDYYTFLVKIALAPEEVPIAVARTAGYHRYLFKLLEYLVDFVKRTQPLADVELLIAVANAEVERLWAEGEVGRWQSKEGGVGAPAAAPAAEGEGDVDISKFASGEENNGSNESC